MRGAAAKAGTVIAVRPREAVYQALKRQILLNELPPDTALTELGVAQRMACSQGTVREALLRLQEDGLVQRSGHRGTAVTPLDAAAASEMIALRRQIETSAARRAGPLSPDMADKLLILVADMDRHAAGNDEVGLIEADIRFHMALFRRAGFAALDQILHRLMLHTHRQKLWAPGHRRSLGETAARHRGLIAAGREGGQVLAIALGGHIDTIVEMGEGASPTAPA